jgi:hypothetical protein
MSTHRLVALAIPFALTACLGRRGDDAEPISAIESAAMSAATESTIVALSPITSANASAIAAAYAQAYPQPTGADGGSCATIETDNLTFVKVTFACQGIFQTTGTLQLAITSPTSIETTSDLTIGSVKIDGVHTLNVPADPAATRTFEGQLSIMGPNRELDSESQASWTVAGNCVTFSASGSVSVGAASGSFTIANKTVCHQ